MIEVKAVKFIEKISKIKTFIILLVSYYCVFFLQKYADINELFTFVYIINIVKNVIWIGVTISGAMTVIRSFIAIDIKKHKKIRNVVIVSGLFLGTYLFCMIMLWP